MKDYSFLLNRPEHAFHDAMIDDALQGKRVLITGAGGTIGSSLARRIVESSTDFLGLVGHSEAPIFNLMQSLPHTARSAVVDKAIVDVGDEPAMRSLIERWRPGIILHCAAHKHVGLMEKQPEAAFRNNTEATLNLAKLAVQSQWVRRFVFVSTDKAVRPTTVMGASKRLAEVGLRYRHSPFATSVRFGNVLGSSGSLVEIAERNFSEGKPVVINDPTMTRYFITAREAVGLVLTAGLLESGDCYSLDMGEPVSIVGLVKKLCPGVLLQCGVPGSGEKIEEHLLNELEGFVATQTPGVLEVFTVEDEPAKFESALALVKHDPRRIVEIASRL